MGIGEDTAAADDKPAAAGAVLPLPLPRQREVGLGVHAEHLDHGVHARHHPHHIIPARGGRLRHRHGHRIASVSNGLRLPAAGWGRRARGVRVGGGLVAARLAAPAARRGGGGRRRRGGPVGGGRRGLELAAAPALALVGGGGRVVHGGGLGFRGAEEGAEPGNSEEDELTGPVGVLWTGSSLR